jgi:dienelactone hydrolase
LAVTITATSVANSLSTASAAVTVPAITVDTEPQSISVVATTTQQFTATVANDPNNKGVTWTLACSTNACGSISSNSSASGAAITYTAPALSSADLSVNLTATSVTDSTKFSTASITVPAIVVQPVSPPSAILPVNATQQFAATTLYDPTNSGVNWTLTQNGANCSPACGSVSPANTASGSPTTFTAPSALPATAAVTLNATAAADSTKSATAAITLTNGTAKLVPAALDFTCKFRPHNFCPPPPQSIALTDTGAAPLTVNNISIVGTNSALFHQSNDCGATLDAGSTCTVTVTFNPVAVGSFSASVSFNDSSTDSPQQATLTGKATALNMLSQDSAHAELETTQASAVPTPTGSERVGTRVIHFMDGSREDPYLTNGSKRELAMRVWYPASLEAKAGCVPAVYTSPAVWNYFAQIVGVHPFPVKTNSCWEAPVGAGTHPVIIFSPGFTATFTDYTFLTEDLASRGYIVASVAHTYETTVVELRDGRLAKSVLGSHLGGPANGDGKSLSTATYARTLDLNAALAELERLNSRDVAFAKKLDLSRIAVAGHSLGALSALIEAQVEPRFKAAILMDGFVPSALPSATRKPVLLIAAGRDHWEPTECHLWNNLAGPRMAVNLTGVEHAAMGDWIWLTPNSVEAGPMGSEKTMAAIREYVATFLDAHLRGVALEPSREQLLSGAATEFPAAVVVRQEQSLCSKP